MRTTKILFQGIEKSEVQRIEESVNQLPIEIAGRMMMIEREKRL
jgi:hypothetical protein